MGIIESIHIAETAGGAMYAIPTATLIAGKGIEGDRYASLKGTFSDYVKDHELTLVEAEVAEELGFAPGETRRNILTRGIRLNDLVGKRFHVGDALCEGTRFCEPCAYLEKVTERPGLVKQMVGRGGLRAIIVEGGTVKLGDAVTKA
jgi:hypothetical protein